VQEQKLGTPSIVGVGCGGGSVGIGVLVGIGGVVGIDLLTNGRNRNSGPNTLFLRKQSQFLIVSANRRHF